MYNKQIKLRYIKEKSKFVTLPSISLKNMREKSVKMSIILQYMKL